MPAKVIVSAPESVPNGNGKKTRLANALRRSRNSAAGEPNARLSRAHHSTFAVGRRNRFSAVADALTLTSQTSNDSAWKSSWTEDEKAAASEAAARRDDSSHASADAIEAFCVVAALVFGFSSSSLIAVACELNEELTAGRYSVAAFCTVTALAAALSGYATVFFTLEVYYLKRLSDEAGSTRTLMIETFMTLTGKWRRFARVATNSALAADLIAISILLWDFLPNAFAYAVTAVLGCGALLVVYTMRNMKKLASACLMQVPLQDAQDTSAEQSRVTQLRCATSSPDTSGPPSPTVAKARSCRRDSDYAVPRRRSSVDPALADKARLAVVP